MTFDERVVEVIKAILEDEDCTYNEEFIDWDNRIFDGIDCPKEKEIIVAQKIEEALAILDCEEEFITLQ